MPNLSRFLFFWLVFTSICAAFVSDGAASSFGFGLVIPPIVGLLMGAVVTFVIDQIESSARHAFGEMSSTHAQDLYFAELSNELPSQLVEKVVNGEISKEVALVEAKRNWAEEQENSRVRQRRESLEGRYGFELSKALIAGQVSETTAELVLETGLELEFAIRVNNTWTPDGVRMFATNQVSEDVAALIGHSLRIDTARLISGGTLTPDEGLKLDELGAPLQMVQEVSTGARTIEQVVAITSGEPILGLLTADVETMWGIPDRRSEKVLKTKRKETFVYLEDDSKRVARTATLENGRLVGWEIKG